MQTIGQVLLFAGVAVTVVSAWAALWLRGPLVRLHYLAPVTTVGAPLIGISVVVASGWSLSSGLVLLIVFSLCASGPTMTIALARVVAQREGIAPGDSPQ